MKNRKGFTLVETLAVIILLGVILMIAVPSINNVVARNNKRRLKEAAEMFVVLAKEKLETDTSIEYPQNIKNCGIDSNLDCNYNFVVLNLESVDIKQLENIVGEGVMLGNSTKGEDSKVVFKYENNKWKNVFVVLYDGKGTAAYLTPEGMAADVDDIDNNATLKDALDGKYNCTFSGGYCYE